MLLSSLNMTLCLGQEEIILSQDGWGDYYFINKNYPAAILAFEKQSQELNLEQQRNFALAYLYTNQKRKAETVYTPVANSTAARVEDYYRYADLLIGQERLAKEYQTKAYKLPWPTPSLYENDSLLFKKRFGSSPYLVEGLETNTTANEYGLVFVSNEAQQEVFFLKDQKDKPRALKRITSEYPIYNFYSANYSLNPFSLANSAEVPFSVNSYFQEGPGTYDAVKDQFYFTRSTNQFDPDKNIQLNVYAIAKQDIEKNKIAVALPINKKGSSTVHPSISPSGKRLFFASDRPGGFGGMDLYYVTINNNQFSEPVNLGPDINTAGDEVFPFAYSDTQLFFSSNGREGLGKLDIYLAEHKIEKRWEAYLLGKELNTKEDDFSFGINKALSLGYLSSNRLDGAGGDDLYTFSFTPEIKGLEDRYRFVPSDTLIVANQGILKNDIDYLNQKDPLQRLVKKEAIQTKPPKNGYLRFHANGSFIYKSRAALAVKDSFAYKLKTVKGTSAEIWVYLVPTEQAKEAQKTDFKEAFSSIYFTFDRSNLLATYLDRIEKVVEVMQKYPSIEIEVRSYTDCRGKATYNQKLAERRTNTIVNYVRSRIDRPERIVGAGFGIEKSFVASNKMYQLIAGSFEDPLNAQKMQDKLKEKGYASSIIKLNGMTRVMAASSNVIANVNAIKAELDALGITTWITERPCAESSEEEHQQNRRTDFKVISNQKR